ncbi:hypothetical protein BON22_4139 [Cyberlindnera fabianii]|uniref:Uncharacterized protein n=1 Tax=Cyberlindnera fabianii TaxID=36022 RepID=A0A1V2L304_CYBFA|nr:hypothetical protein BON22_4139 [Cyberlindnera fabianii]
MSGRNRGRADGKANSNSDGKSKKKGPKLSQAIDIGGKTITVTGSNFAPLKNQRVFGAPHSAPAPSPGVSSSMKAPPPPPRVVPAGLSRKRNRDDDSDGSPQFKRATPASSRGSASQGGPPGRRPSMSSQRTPLPPRDLSSLRGGKGGRGGMSSSERGRRGGARGGARGGFEGPNRGGRGGMTRGGPSRGGMRGGKRGGTTDTFVYPQFPGMRGHTQGHKPFNPQLSELRAELAFKRQLSAGPEILKVSDKATTAVYILNMGPDVTEDVIKSWIVDYDEDQKQKRAFKAATTNAITGVFRKSDKNLVNTIQTIKFDTQKSNGKSRGNAYVEFRTSIDAILFRVIVEKVNLKNKENGASTKYVTKFAEVSKDPFKLVKAPDLVKIELKMDGEGVRDQPAAASAGLPANIDQPVSALPGAHRVPSESIKFPPGAPEARGFHPRNQDAPPRVEMLRQQPVGTIRMPPGAPELNGVPPHPQFPPGKQPIGQPAPSSASRSPTSTSSLASTPHDARPLSGTRPPPPETPQDSREGAPQGPSQISFHVPSQTPPLAPPQSLPRGPPLVPGLTRRSVLRQAPPGSSGSTPFHRQQDPPPPQQRYTGVGPTLGGARPPLGSPLATPHGPIQGHTRGLQQGPPQGPPPGGLRPPQGYNQGPPSRYYHGPPSGYRGPPPPQQGGYQQGPPPPPSQQVGYKNGAPPPPGYHQGQPQGPPQSYNHGPPPSRPPQGYPQPGPPRGPPRGGPSQGWQQNRGPPPPGVGQYRY